MADNGLVALASTLRQLLAAPKSLEPQSKEEQDARLDIIDMIPDLSRVLLGDKQTLRDLAWSHIQVLSLHTVYRYNIASLIPVDSSVTYDELAKHVPIPLVSLRRLIRHAMTSSIFHEPKPDHVAHTSMSLLLATDPKILGLVDLLTSNIWPAAAYTCEALEKWPGSVSPRETGYSMGLRRAIVEGTSMAGKIALYEEVAKDPAATARFRDAMEYFSSGEGYEVSSLVTGYDWAGLENGTVVDIGGANGFVSHEISQAFPRLNFVVQDIVMDDTMSSEYQSQQIKFMAHDFFTPQPIKGADVYLMRWILHNWTDDKCVQILKNLVPALKKGSRVVANDGALPEPGKGRWFDERASRTVDIIMMAAHNARTREERDWAVLFESADPRYKFLGTRKPEGSRMSIIEAEWEGDGPDA